MIEDEKTELMNVVKYDDDKEEILDSNIDRSLYDRLFSKVESGSVRGSIFTLSIMCLGSGLLALPKKFKYMSISVAIVDVILAGCAAYWTLTLMILTAKKYKIYEYSKLCEKLYGRWLSLFADLTLLVYVLGILILYQVLSKNVFKYSLSNDRSFGL